MTLRAEWWTGLALLGLGCGPPPCLPILPCLWADDEPVVPDDAPEPVASATLTDSLPWDGADDVFVRDDLRFVFSAPPRGIDVDLQDDAGDDLALAEVARDDGLVITADPVADLEPLREYTATVRWSGGEESIGFSTSDTGLPLLDPAAVAGGAWILDLRRGTAIAPGGVDFVWPEGIVPGDLLLVVDPASDLGAGEIRAQLAWSGSPGGSPTCVGGASEAAGAEGTWEDPDLETSARDLPMRIGDATSVLYDMVLHATLSPDGELVDGGRITGIFDVRPFDGTATGQLLEGGACGYLDAVGKRCEPCPDGVVACHPVEIERVRGVRVQGIDSTGFLWDNDCESVIAAGPLCADEAAAFDPDGDGFFQLCPGWYD